MKFIKVKWFPLIIVVIAVLAIAFVLFCCGFRITYAPELENDWDAISAVATWTGTIVAVVSAIASFLAVWFAIQVPKKIAEEQNRIALFEKRHDAYSSILSLEVFADALDHEEYKDGDKDPNGEILTLRDKVGLYCLHFATTLGYPPRVHEGHIDIDSITRTISLLKQYEIKATALPLLFYTNDEESNEMKQKLSDIFEPLLIFMTEVVTCTFDEHSKIDDLNRQKFVAALKLFKQKYSAMFEKELSIRTR